MPRLLYSHESSPFRMVSFMLRLIYNFQISPLSDQLHALSALPIPKLRFRVFSFTPRLIYN